VIGTVVSGAFLILIAAVNLVVLVGIVRLVRRLCAGSFDEAALEQQLANRGLIARLLKRVTGAVGRPWHMYPIGLLFGLGFDTATEVSLLVLAGGAAAFALPWYAILTLNRGIPRECGSCPPLTSAGRRRWAGPETAR
jgi:high-affinity nickel-transport protein